ncbi:DUF4476 domain-containing protein [Aquisphaera giovannonii]|nr:DUF4476 domain-containing protein [Aquisphaera giovannonii]
MRLGLAPARLFVLPCLLSAPYSACFGQPAPGSGEAASITPAQAKVRADEIVKDLREAAAEARKIGDRALRERIELRLSRAELKARELAEELSRVRPAPVTASALPLSDAESEKLLQGLKKEPFDDGKLTFIENFATARPLTCRQAAALIRAFSFDEKRVAAAKALYPRLLDRQNFNDVLGAFTFDSNKVLARKAVGLK